MEQEPKITSPEEELEYLRKRIRDIESVKDGGAFGRESVKEVIKNYTKEDPDRLLSEEFRVKEDEIASESKNIGGEIKEAHIGQVSKLVFLARERGILNAVTIAGKLDPHLEDDFHDYLVESLKGVLFSTKVGDKKVKYSLEFTLYEIFIPESKLKGSSEEGDFKRAIAAMEQFYAGMSSFGIYYVLEIGLPLLGDEVSFYCAVVKENGHIFEKQIQGIFPGVKVARKDGDYNIFKPEGFSLGSVAKLKRNSALPLADYEKLGVDPLGVVLNTFTKFKKDGEGAALQMIVMREESRFVSKVRSIISKMRKGETFGKAAGGGGFLDAVIDMFLGSSKSKTKEENKTVDEETIKLLERKMSKRVLPVNFRLIVSSKENFNRAEKMLDELESAFAQFSDPTGNSIVFSRLKGGSLRKLLHNFSYRMINKKENMELNLAELAGALHLPSEKGETISHQLKQSKTKEVSAPLNLPQGGLYLGKNVFRGEEKPVFIKDDDRRRHFYVIGQTGTGKSVFLKNMMIQDIEAGKGICFIDPHGQDLQDILSRIPQSRIDDVIYFNPGDVNRPLGLNMLEYDPRYPEQKTFIVNELFSIFDKLYDMKTAGGPMFEQYFKMTTLLLMEDASNEPATLMDVARVFTDDDYRARKLARITNPVVVDFWEKEAAKATGDHSLANMSAYITSKVNQFTANDFLRPIIGQEKSAFDFRKVMDEGKILLVNLSKGRLGELNSGLLGLVLVGKILMASLSRTDIPEEERKDFYLYIDEFQNITTDSISSILSEARKYKLNLIIAHQFISQLKENISKAIFGNVGSMAAFRVGAEDAEFLEKQFAPVFEAYDIMNVDNYNAYLKILIDGQISKPFSVKALPFEKGDISYGKGIAEMSSLKYGRDRNEVEEEIRGKY